MRHVQWSPVGANNEGQKADFGGVLSALGIIEELEIFAREISRVERDLLWARDSGLDVPPYVLKAMREAVALHAARD
jgi:hypothetical protein